jgi:myosin-crossreactive antigen
MRQVTNASIPSRASAILKRPCICQFQPHWPRLYTSAAIRARAPETKSDEQIGPERSIGIVGGGISGLSTAYYLSERWKGTYFRTPKVTIYESSDQLGGWIGTEKLGTPDGGYVRVEKGPRTLAASPAGMITMDMVWSLLFLERTSAG